MRTARTALGAPVGARPWVTYAIMAICIVVFIAQKAVPDDIVTNDLAFWPPYARAEPWRFVTSAFVHSPGLLVHIAFNLYALYLIGPDLERLLGWARFVVTYLLCAVGGSVGVLLLASTSAAPDSSWFTAVVGASGAVFGVWGALMVVNRKLGRDNRGLLALLVINGVIGFLPGANIAWQGHLGGLLTGLLCGAVLAYAPKDRRTEVQLLGLAAVAVLLVVSTMLKLSAVPPALLS
jgi:membrane associated rhomboid family serine protease